MSFSFFGLVLAVHVLGAVMWAGATLFMAIVVFPALRRRGPEADDDFNEAVMRNGGFGRFFTPIAAVTLLTGAYVYWTQGHLAAPFGGTNVTLVTLGGLSGMCAFLYTLFLMHPRERRLLAWLREHPAPLVGEAKRRFREESQGIGKLVAIGSPLLFLALLLMLVRGFIA